MRFRLLIEPIDVLFFRDGRENIQGRRSTGGLPQPQTLLGAIRTRLWAALDLDFSKLNRLQSQRYSTVEAAARLLGANSWAAQVRVAGPWFCRNDDDILVPVPADLVAEGRKSGDGRILRLRPAAAASPGWVAPEAGMLPLWYYGLEEVTQLKGWINLRGLEAWVAGRTPVRENVVPESKSAELFVWEDRTGVAIVPGRNTAAEGLLYSVRFLRLQENVRLVAELELPDGHCDWKRIASLLDGTMSLGGEGRQVRVSVQNKTIPWPQAPREGQTTCLMLTHGMFAAPYWRPAQFAGQLVAAVVPGFVPVSGWDLATRMPKPVRNAVPAGSTYYLKSRIGGSTVDIVDCDNSETRLQGYNVILKGVWPHD